MERLSLGIAKGDQVRIDERYIRRFLLADLEADDLWLVVSIFSFDNYEVVRLEHMITKQRIQINIRYLKIFYD